MNTIDPGTRFSGGAPGKSAGSSGRSATVTYPVAGDELGELAVGDLEAVDPEPVDIDGMRRRLLRVVVV